MVAVTTIAVKIAVTTIAVKIQEFDCTSGQLSPGRGGRNAPAVSVHDGTGP
jgi:hypothetical protein